MTAETVIAVEEPLPEQDRAVDPVPDRPTRRAGARRRVVTLIAACVLAALVGAAWSLASPIGASPDDDFHLASIWCSDLAPADGCVPGERDGELNQRLVQVPAPIAHETLVCYFNRPAESAACMARTSREPGLLESRANLDLYPGGYYDLMAPLVSEDEEASVQRIRLLSWALCCVLIGASLLVAERRTRQAFLLALVVTAVPMGVFLFASNNPSGVTVAGTFAFACALTTFLTSTSNHRTAISGVVAAAGAIAALTARADAGVWLSVAAVAVVVITVRWRPRFPRRVLLPAAVVVVSGLMILLSGVAGVADEGLSFDPSPRPYGEVLFRNLTELPGLWVGSLGTFPVWIDTPMPAVTSVGMVGAFFTVVVMALRRPSERVLIALGVIVVGICVIPIYALAADGSVIPAEFQPRYLLPIITIVPALAWLGGGAARTSHLLSPFQKAVLAAAVSLANLAALHTITRRYVWGLDQDGFNLDSDDEWWWSSAPGPMVVWIVGSLAGAALVALLLFAVDRPVPQETSTALVATSANGQGSPEKPDASTLDG